MPTKMTYSKVCPSCGATHPIRVRRPFWLKGILGFLPIRAYRCSVCSRSFHRFVR